VGLNSHNQILKQNRTHAKIYYDRVTSEQSKYIALHIGIFWGIGTFVIKNGDKIMVMLDLQSMYDMLKKNFGVKDTFTVSRINFIKQLSRQRNIDLKYELISTNENQAKILN